MHMYRKEWDAAFSGVNPFLKFCSIATIVFSLFFLFFFLIEQLLALGFCHLKSVLICSSSFQQISSKRSNPMMMLVTGGESIVSSKSSSTFFILCFL